MAKTHGGKRKGAGRPKGYAALVAETTRSFIASEIKKSNAPIVKRAIEDAKKGDKHARDWLYEFAFGKPTQPITGANGDPLFQPTVKDKEMAKKALLDLLA